jgi:hypothetical protein
MVRNDGTPSAKRKKRVGGNSYDSDDSFVVGDSAFDDDLMAVGEPII